VPAVARRKVVGFQDRTPRWSVSVVDQIYQVVYRIPRSVGDRLPDSWSPDVAARSPLPYSDPGQPARTDRAPDALWVPSAVSRRLTSAFAASRPPGHGPQPDQHDRLLWPSDSRT
jgi:hypothetical protein